MTRTVLTATAFTLLAPALTVLANDAGDRNVGPGQQVVDAAARNNQFAFILFYRTTDAATHGMHQILQDTLAERADAVMTLVRISDAADSDLVARFDASRTPMPAVVVLAPNGAVTSVFPQRVTPQHLTAAIVSAAQAQCLKALQDKKIVLLCVHPEGDVGVPEGVRQLQGDELYKDRTEVVNVQANDAAEARFLQQLKVPTDRSTSTTVLMAPPGVLLGMYDSTVTHEILAQKLAAAGKCCDDPNCKHRRTANGNPPIRR